MRLIVFAQHASDQQFPRSVATFHAGLLYCSRAWSSSITPAHLLLNTKKPPGHRRGGFFRAEDADIRDLSTPGAASEGSEDAAVAVGDLLTSAH